MSVVAYLVTLLFFFPVIWLVIASLKTENAAVALPPKILFHPTFSHYTDVFGGGGFLHALLNSIIAAAGGGVLAVALGIPAAFALTIYPTKRNGSILFWFLSTKMLPMSAVIVPLYVIAQTIHMLDNIWLMLIIYAAMDVPLVIWILFSFFREIPVAVWEAAELDGIGVFRMVTHLVIPLVRTGISSSFLILLVLNWNEFFVAVNLGYTKAATLPVLISSYMSSEGLFWAHMSAVGVLSILPIVIVGWLVHKQFVRGMTFGAVK